MASHAPATGSGPAGGPASSLPGTLPGAEQAAVSLFELPVSRGARWARILAILALDAVLAGAGIAMIVSYMHSREGTHSAPPPGKDAGLAEVQVLTPVRPDKPITPTSTAGARPADMAQPAALAPGPAAEPASEADIERISRDVGLIVNRNTAQLQRCYHQAAKSTTTQDPIEGRLEIHIEIATSGRATQVYPIKNTSGSDLLARCVTALFDSWTYPQPPGNDSLELVWPLHFKAPK